MRILLVGTCLGVGGAESVMVNLADAYAANGHTVHLVALSPPICLRPRSECVGVTCLDGRSVIDLPKIVLRMHRIIDEFDPDVVHAHLFHAIVITRLLRLVRRIPKLVATVHSTRVGGRFRAAAYRWTERLSDVNTCVSEDVAKRFLQQGVVGNKPIQVVHNGIAVGSFARIKNARQVLIREYGLHQSARLIVSIGRLEAAKDYPNLLLALQSLKKQGIKYNCVVAGEGSLKGMLVERSRVYGLEDLVLFVGLRRDVPLLLSAADVFVLSSAWEGLPIAVGEAMACGCVVVATDCGGVRELVGDTGFLVPTGDAELLAAKIVQALRLSNEQRKRLGNAAKERVRKYFSLDASVSRWLEIYGKDHKNHPYTKSVEHN